MYFLPLNFLRFILAVGVLLFHYGLNFFPFNLPVFKTLILNSSFRVSFFFFISGFVMTLVYGTQNKNITAREFYSRRLTRIIPLYWLAFIITILVVLGLKGASPKGFVIILHALGLQSWNPGYVLDLNFTTWSISVELFFYSLFPFLLRWMMKMQESKLLLITIVVWIIQSIQHILFVEYLSDGSKVIEEFINAFPLWHLGTFFAGMSTAIFLSKERLPDLYRKNALPVLLFSLGVFFYFIYLPNPILKYIHNGLLAPLYFLLVTSLYYDTSMINRILSKKKVSMLGDFSYGIFIFQYPLWVICQRIFPAHFQTSAYFFFIYFAMVLATSWLLNRYFEKPVLRYLRKNK